MAREVVCKRENGVRITHLGLDDGKSYAVEALVKWLDSGEGALFTRAGGIVANVMVVQANGRRFLRTDPDQTTRNNLELLPACWH